MDGLRLALIIFGIVLVAVIYFWTSRRRRLDREAGDFDRFDAWTNEELDPLAPSAPHDSIGAGRGADVFDGALADDEELTQPDRRLGEVKEALERDSGQSTVNGESAGDVRIPAATGHAADGVIGQADPALTQRRTAPRGNRAGEDSAPTDVAPDDESTPRSAALDEVEVIEDLEAIADSLDVRSEPHIGTLDDMQLSASPSTPSIRVSAPATTIEADESPSKLSPDGGPRERGERVRSQAPQQADESSVGAEMVIVLNVMARAEQAFDGPSLKAALEEAGLKPGDMQLYHYRAETQSDDTAPIFSALNTVRPGTLDVAQFEAMRTPGVALILRIPGLERPGEAFELMLVAARRIAEALDGQVCDDTRSTLTGQALNHLRERIATVAFQARSGS